MNNEIYPDEWPYNRKQQTPKLYSGINMYFESFCAWDNVSLKLETVISFDSVDLNKLKIPCYLGIFGSLFFDRVAMLVC